MDIKIIEGIWEVHSVSSKDEVFYPKGNSPLVDYYSLNSDSTGVKKKLKPNFNKTFSSSFDKVKFRILKNNATLRVVLPDMKMMFDAFDKRDASYLEDFRKKQFSRSDYLLGYDSWLRLITRNFAGHIVDRFSDAELENMYKDLDRNQFINEIIKYEKFVQFLTSRSYLL